MRHKRQVAPFIGPDEEHCYESSETKRAVARAIMEELSDRNIKIKHLPPEEVPPNLLVQPASEKQTPPTAGFVGLWEEAKEQD